MKKLWLGLVMLPILVTSTQSQALSVDTSRLIAGICSILGGWGAYGGGDDLEHFSYAIPEFCEKDGFDILSLERGVPVNSSLRNIFRFMRDDASLCKKLGLIGILAGLYQVYKSISFSRKLTQAEKDELSRAVALLQTEESHKEQLS